MIKADLHVHLFGCLTAAQLWEIGKDCYQARGERLEWFAVEYQQAWGYKPAYQTYWEAENGFELLERDYTFTTSNSFARFQANFNLIIALCPLLVDNFAVQERIIREADRQQLAYFEARTLIPPHFTAAQAHTYLSGLCATVSRLNRELPLTTTLVFSLARDNLLAITHYQWLRAFIAQEPAAAAVIAGIDFASAEEGFPPHSKAELFKTFRRDNLNLRKLGLLYHVGESFSDKTLISAMRWIVEAQAMGATRLGHAIALGVHPENYRNQTVRESRGEWCESARWLIGHRQALADHGYEVDLPYYQRQLQDYSSNDAPWKELTYTAAVIADMRALQTALAALLKSQNTVIECCPTSNLRIGQLRSEAYHPLKHFIATGLQVVLGTDDPGIFATDWQRELAIAESLSGNSSPSQTLAHRLQNETCEALGLKLD